MQRNEIVRLQSALDSAQTERDSATRSLASLRSSHNDTQHRLTESLERVKDLSSQLAESEASFRAEIETQKRLVDAMEAREADRSKRMEEIEEEWEQRRADVEARESEATEIVERERKRADESERRLNEMREAAERLGGVAPSDEVALLRGDRAGTPASVGGFGAGTPGTPLARILQGGGSGMMSMLSPAAALASKMQRSGMSITEVYGQLVATQDELAKERAEVGRLSECLAQILAEIEDRVRHLVCASVRAPSGR